MWKIESDKIVLIEDHHQAYYEWKKQGFENLTLVHLDAHVDFEFPEIKDEKTILREAKSLNELKTQLEKTLLFERYKFDQKKLTTIGNYIYPAMRDGIIKKLFWVIPGGMSEFKKSLALIRRLLKNFGKQDPYDSNGASFEPGFIKTKLYNRSFHICNLETLPELKEPTLLDIDVDFLVMDCLKNADPTVNIGNRKPWIIPEELVRKLIKKIYSPLFTTVAYSVNGGFTPIVYKMFGDQVAQYLGCSDPELRRRILAGEYFIKFRDSFDKQRFKDAKHYYLQALKLNPKYEVSDNNFGPLYLEIENYTQADKEFKGILRVEKNDSFSLSGLGRIYSARRRYKEAEFFYKKALKLKPDNKIALLGLSKIEFKLKNYASSKHFLSRYERMQPMQGFSRYLFGKIYEKENKPREALTKYKEALQLGQNDINLLLNLVKLSRKFDRDNLDYLKRRVADYEKYFYKIEKKNLEKKNKLSKIRQFEAQIKRFNDYFEG